LASRRANRIPIQDRGPCPKAMKVNLKRIYNKGNKTKKNSDVAKRRTERRLGKEKASLTGFRD
jgi:hypothetical protein